MVPRDRTLRPALLAALLAAAGTGACRQPPAPPPPTARHVVLVTLDTLRADHLGVYGGDVATPHLDRLAREGALVEQATAHVPLTRASHVSLFAGLLPSETGVRDNLSPAAAPPTPLLAEVLRGAGFTTGAFVSAVVVSAAASGLDRGFDHYADDFEADPEDPGFLRRAQMRGDGTVARAAAWLEEHRAAERLFLWLHLYDPHEPYQAPEPFASRYPGRPYAGEVAWTDELVGRLVETLERLGLAADTLLVATSDHGEGLGEHDEQLHGFFAYETTLRVPLLLRGPGIPAGTRLTTVTGLVDLYPTILELAGVPPPPGATLSGRSLARALRGGPAPPQAPLYAETLVPRLRFGWSDLRVMREGSWKYIQAPRPELYDLAADPAERVNLLDREGPRALSLRRTLDGFLAREAEARASRAVESAGELAPELLEKLQALGYLGGAAPAATPTPGADPKDKIEDFRLANDLMRRALASLGSGDLRDAAARLQELLGRGIESSETHLHLGRALLGLGRFTDAADHFARAIALPPAQATAWLGLAEARLQGGKPEEALAALREGEAVHPRDGALRREEGRLLRLLGRPGEARRAFEAALELDGGDARVHAALGELLRELGDVEGAAAQQRRAVELEPERAGWWNSLGMTLGGLGRLTEAEEAFRQALRLDPTDHRHAYNLGLALLRQGRAGEARPFFEQALELAPEFTPARQRLAELGAPGRR